MESIFIKKRLAAFAVLLGLGAGGVPVFAQQTDPALTAAVVAQTAELKSIHKKRRKLQAVSYTHLTLPTNSRV